MNTLTAPDSQRFLVEGLYVASSPCTKAPALAELAVHPDAEVRWQVADHRNTPTAVLINLLADTDPAVREAAEYALVNH